MNTHPGLGRRGFLQGALALGAAAAVPSLAACGTGTSRASGGTKKLIVRNSGGTYGDAHQKAVFEPFTKETGIPIQVVNIDYAQMVAQVEQGRPQFDVADLGMYSFLQLERSDALEKLDYDRLKNFKKAGVADNLVTPHAVGKNYWASVMAYRTDSFGGKNPSSWADVWDPRGFPGSRSLQSPDGDMPELEFALLADGVPLDQLYPLDVDRAFRSLDRIKGSVKKYWDTGTMPGILLSRKEVTISTVWHGRLNDLIAQGVPLAYEWNGARRQSNGWGIPKGASNLDAAYQLIDYSLRPEVQANLAKVYPMAPAVPAAYKLLSEEERSQLASSPEHLETGFDLNVEWWLDNEKAVVERWLEWARA